MLLAIDAGNTNITFALFDGDRTVAVWRTKTDSGKTTDDYMAWLWMAFHRAQLGTSVVKETIVASVVPECDYALRILCRDMFGSTARLVTASTVPMQVKLPNPAEVGADRLVNAFAAWKLYGVPGIVIDLGTATTFDVIDSDAAYCGGVIAPGLNLSLEALYHAAAKLPKVAVSRPARVVGTGTVGAIQSGLYWGYVGLIEGLLQRIKNELFAGVQPVILTTGGLGRLLSREIPGLTGYDADLTVKGLRLLAQTL